MSEGTAPHVTVEIDGPVALLTLNRPDRLNAFTPRMAQELVEAIDRTDEDDAVRAVIITGAGRAFCAGADLNEKNINRLSPELAGIPRDSGGVVALRFAASRKPLIAAINGAAIGVGATMTLPMDVRIAAESARFGFVFVRRGIAPESASSWFLPRVVGIGRALEWSLTGRIFDAAEALSGGLVQRVVPADALLSSARAIALEIAENTGPVAVAATRQLLWSQLSEPSPWRSHARETVLINQLKASGDPAEAGAAFLEKRRAEFVSTVSANYPVAAPRWPARPSRMAPWMSSELLKPSKLHSFWYTLLKK